MDRSALFSTRSPFSPRSRQNISSRRSVGTSFKKSSRLSVSGRSAQSLQLILKSQWNYVERFGHPLPVLVTEALTFSERNTIVTARISSECGYAWLVCGRRLLIWQYRQNTAIPQTHTPRRGLISNQCYELQLPQSDLAHRAELVSIFLTSGNTLPSCIAVSPEGLVRYWPAIANEEVSVEQSVDLHGQECDSLTGIEGLGCILATTTCTVVLVQPNMTSGRHILNCRTLKTPSGWLGGFSKKMSSLIFGPISSEQSTETRLVRVLAIPFQHLKWMVYVLAGHSLQKWILSSTEPEQFVYGTDITRLIRDGFYSTIWESTGGDHTDTDTWILDLQTDNENVVLLAAAVNLHQTPQIYYALISFDASNNQPVTQLNGFTILKMSGLYREENPSETLGYKFLMNGNCSYIFNHRSITVIKPQEDPDCLEFNSMQDFLLGGSICINTPVFFSRNHGLVAVCSNDMSGDLNLSILSTGTQAETSYCDTGAEQLILYNFNPEEISAAYKDTISQMKAAFLFYIKQQYTSCNDIIHQLFLSEGASVPGVDGILDKVVISVSQDLLDDIPANDPRWLGEYQVGLGSSYAMQVTQQLEDKQKAHASYLKFLKETELWKKLSAVTLRESPIATTCVLGENVEKLAATIVLKSLPYDTVLQDAFEKVVDDIEVDAESGLTTQDIFYREVSKVYHGLNELVNNCEAAVHTDRNPVEVANLINQSNNILLTVLRAVMEQRYQNQAYFEPSQSALDIAPDYLPWTSAPGPSGLMDCLISQQHLTYMYGIKVISDNNLRTALYEQLIALIDHILDGRKNHLESIKGRQHEHILLKQYQTDRKKLIDPLIQSAQWEGAALLAEKYLDFESLVIICEKTNNETRLDEYMDRFSDKDFSQFVFNWYLQQNKQGKLLNRCKRMGGSRNTQQLGQFLSQHPSLSWIQFAIDKQYNEAAETLKDLAENECDSVTRQKTMFSMAKLAKLAMGNREGHFLDDINARLELITYQEDIPDYVLKQFGYDTTIPSVIPPKDLVYLYICPEYSDATEVEFNKALSIISFITDDDLRNELNLKIWKNAILRDSWDEKNLDSPLDILQNKLIFKTADLALTLGADHHTLLPPLDALTEDSDLIELQNNKSFQYLIKTGYEHVSQVAHG